MKKDMDKIIIESRSEIDLLQNVCDGFLSKCKGEERERELAKKLSAMLDDMYMSW